MSRKIVNVNGTRAAKRHQTTATTSAAINPTIVRNDYSQLVQQLKKLSPDWQVNRVGIDSEIYRNHWELRAYSRNLFRENPYVIGWCQDLCGQVFGPNGYTYRMMIKEEEDRVIHTPQEKAVLRSIYNRRAEVAAHFSQKHGRKIKAQRTFRELKGVATVQVGQPDVFACQLIERMWAEWQLRENCTVTGRISYNESRQLRLKSCARDGEHYIRMVRDSSYKPFGFKIQHINAEWCSYYFTGTCKETKNPVRFGIEYDDSGPAPVPVAYHFVKGTSAQWQGFAPSAGMGGSEEACTRIPAEDIIHYAKFDEDADVTRPVPWTTPVMSNARQLAKWMEAAVVAARVGACSSVFFEADLIGPDGTAAGQVDPDDMKKLIMEMNPGGMHGLPPGVRANSITPSNPNPATGGFRNEALREMCAGLAGAQFSTIGQNYAEINFSAGRLERLTMTAQWMLLQEFDISTAERRIFAEWLKMALITGAVPLPLAKFKKFNNVQITGRRWEGVDALKEGAADAQDLANNVTSLQRIHDKKGTDLETILSETAEAIYLMDMYGIDTSTTKGPTKSVPEQGEEEEKSKPTKKTP